MTPSEFKAWFDGFTEALDGTPSKEQWARIKKRVSEIDGTPVTERIFVDRYVHPYWPQSLRGYWETTQLTFCVTGVQGQSYNGLPQSQQMTQNAHWCSANAMQALGRAEAASLS